MRTLRQINIKTVHIIFFNDMINIKNFDPSLLDIDKISFKSNDAVIYDVNYITIKSLGSENSLYLIFNNVDVVYIEESNEDKCLIFASADKNKKVLENYAKRWDEIKDQIEIISGVEPIENKKDFMKIKVKSGDDFPLGKILSIPLCIIVVAFVFQEDDSYYQQAHLHECLHEREYDESEDENYSIV